MASWLLHVGLTVPIERKRELYAICAEYDVVIIEDDPYYYLQFGVRGEPSGTAHMSSNAPNVHWPGRIECFCLVCK